MTWPSPGAAGVLLWPSWAVSVASWTVLTPSWAVLGSSWATLAALVACLDRLGRRKRGSFAVLRGIVASGARISRFLQRIVVLGERIMSFFCFLGGEGGGGGAIF